MKSALHSRISVADAGYYYLANVGPHTDWIAYWVFDSSRGNAQSESAVAAHFADRDALLGTLKRRLFAVPGELDFPYWIADDRPITDYLVHHHDPIDWSHCQVLLGTLAATRLNPTDRAFCLHVFHHVQGVPGVPSEATVVAFEVTHTMLAGGSYRALTDTLFATSPEPLTVPGLPSAARRVSTIAAVARAVGRVPVETARFVRSARRALRAQSADASGRNEAGRRRTVTRFNRSPSNERSVGCVAFEVRQLRVPQYTVTEVMATAVSLAMQRYLDTRDGGAPSDLACVLTAVLKDAQMNLAVNWLGSATVDINQPVEGIDQRAAQIREQFRNERDRLSSPSESARRLAMAVQPRWSNRRDVRAYSAMLAERKKSNEATTHSVISSVNCGSKTDWSLSDSPFVFCGGTPPLLADLGLVHGVVGAGDILTVTVLTTPEIMPDLDAYLELICTAVDEVSDALTADGVLDA